MSSFETAFETISDLVNQFEENFKYYSSPNYQEAEARKDFIDKFFEALGWDVNHNIQTNPYKQEVKVEKSQRQQNSTSQKRADYAFYLDPNYKEVQFFVEAKKPSVGLWNEDHYFQTIRYGWNANTPIAVLTDFEEFHIIDCRYKPDIRYVFNGQHKKFHFTDYKDKEKFAFIYWLFSREAVADNSIIDYASDLPKPKGKAVQKTLFKGGYQTIDDSFLAYIDDIRESLAKAFKKNDESLSSNELTEAVQRTVDRLVFIRFLEDKLIEPTNHVSQWRGWKDFILDCRKLDAKYNGVVFKEHFIDKQNFSGAEETQFLQICSDISNLNSPYDFNYIPIHILGSIYERFLGKIVRATDKRVFIEEKPEVRKAGGVYYTPKYIVDYIVKNTVGTLISGKVPSEIDKMHFADISCGSGSFLISVYETLLEYHKDYYQNKLKNKIEIDGRSEDFGNVFYRDGVWNITLKRKQEILINSVFGVDIDQQAVEVTQLSLFLKMLEDETLSSTQVTQGSIFSKVLPDLSKNIICGNSLIGTDILSDNLFTMDEEIKLNPMDYKSVFPHIMKIENKGFDAIVGNPPYVMLQNLDNRFSFEYTSKNYFSAKYKIDTYQIFIERSINLLKKDGLLGFIIPNTFLKNIHSEPLRKFILLNTDIKELLLFDYPVFKGASVDTCLLFVKKGTTTSHQVSILKATTPDEFFPINQIKQEEFLQNEKYYFNLTATEIDKTIIDKVSMSSTPLKYYCDAYFGIQTFDRKKYVSTDKINNNYKKVIDGWNIERYYLKPSEEFVHFIPAAIKSGGKEHIYTQDRICFRQIGETPVVTYVPANTFTLNTVYNIYLRNNSLESLHFLLGIINSKLTKFIWLKTNTDQKGTFPKIKKEAILGIQIKKIENSREENIRIQIINLVKQLLDTKEKSILSRTDREKNFYDQKATALDQEIDNLIYELYNITDEERAIIEKD